VAKLTIRIWLIRQIACLWIVMAVTAFVAPITAQSESAPKAERLLLLGDRDYPPVNFIENGVGKGVMIDIVQAISQAVGRQVAIELTDWEDAQTRVQKGEADGLIGMSVTEERKKLFDFTEPVAKNEFSLFVRSTDTGIKGINDLAGLTVAVTGGGLPRQFMVARSGIRVVPVDTYRDGLERLTDGRVDVFAADRWVAAYVIRKNKIRGVKIAGAPFASLPAAIAFRKGNPQLVGEFNRAIEELQRNGTIGRILDKWRPQEMVFLTQGRVHEIVIAAVSVFLLLIAAFMAAWIATLKKQIRERKQADTEIRKLLDQVRQDAVELEKRVAERTVQLKSANEQLEAFAYSVSHDLKAPLRGIDGYSRLLLQDYAPHLDDDGRFFIATIRESAQQMQQLIDDLLAYSRLERRAVAISAIKLPAFADAVLETFSSQFESRGITLQKSINPTTIQADAEGLGIALRNLVDNAIKFTLNTPEPVIEIGGKETETSYILWVRDNGIGFDMQYHDRIFEIFQRLQRVEEYPGTGIGLALVNKSMERMGGRAWAQSSAGMGAAFYLEVPQ
jgi:signal transduction histidine kinase